MMLFYLMCVHLVLVHASKVGVHKSKDLHVELSHPPTRPYSHIVAQRGQIIYLSCKVNYQDNVNITWQHNHRNITHPPPYRLPWKFGSILMVRPLLKKMDGLYECIVRRKDKVVRKGVFVNIKKENELPAGFPIIVTHPQDVQEPRPAVHFNCVVIGQQPLTITWYHERVPISSNSVYRISMIPSKKKVTSNLEIENVSLAEKGFYQCVATNQFGQVVSKQANVLFSQHGAKRRYRRQLPDDYHDDGVKTGCVGADNNPDGYPGQIPEKKITFHCEKSQQHGGYFFMISWGLPSDAADKTVDSYQLSFDYGSSTLMCFQVKKNQFFFTKKRGFVEGQIYDLAITPRPTPYALSTNMIRIGKCPHDPTYPPVTTSNVIYTSAASVPLTKNEQTNKTKIVWIIVGIFVGAVLIIIAVVIRLIKPKPDLELEIIESVMDVYVSHCALDNKEKERILQLASLISSYGVSVCIDLCSQVEINQVGGLPHWVPDKMANVKKILLIISPCYLQALQCTDKLVEQQPDQICKVNTEFSFIKTMLFHHSCQPTPELVVLLDGVKQKAIPDLCKGRTLCQYPKTLRVNDDNLSKLLGLLLDTERYQIANETVVASV